MSQTRRLEFPRLSEQQQFPEVTFNLAVQLLGVFRLHPMIKDRDLTAQPGSPAEGDMYLLPASSTGGDWAGNDGRLAAYVNSAWHFRDAEQNIYYVEDEDQWVKYDGVNGWTNAAVTS